MSSSPAPSGLAAARAKAGSAWLPARTALAFARSRPFAIRWAAVTGGAAVIAFILPFLSGDSGRADRARLERMAADTLRSAQRLRAADQRVAAAESLLIEVRREHETARAAAARPRTSGTTAARLATADPSTDPAVIDLDARIAEARRARSVAAYLEVSEHPAVRLGPRMRLLADSLRTMDGRIASEPDSPDLAVAIGRVGRTIVAMAEYRRQEMTGTAPVDVAVEPPPAATLPTTITSPPPDTNPIIERLSFARDTVARARRTHDSLTIAMRATGAARGPAPQSLASRLLPGIALLVLLVVGIAARVIAALRRELATPTVADAAEAERITGLRVLAAVREAPEEGPARFRPSGVDPFRMLYLGLTATGTRARTAIVVGEDPDVTAAVGSRLAIAAAADHRNTLIVDLDPARIAVSRTFRERAEPGLHDVLARAFTWREVARPVGSSDGLPITLLPAGTERDDRATGDAGTQLLAEFARLRAAYELTIVVTSLKDLTLALELVEGSQVVLSTVAGESTVSALVDEVSALRSGGKKVQGLVVWSAPRPQLPTRAELAALLGKRKGRTPGGSFEAVRRVVGDNDKGTKKP